jgi:ParB-like chromosome segregation protein Spo0J
MDKDNVSKIMGRLRKAILSCVELPEKERVAAYNCATMALREMIGDLCEAPVLGVQLVASERISSNDYNPNHVASPELDLLEHSIRCDGVTMPIVGVRNGKDVTIVDGFHRDMVCRKRLGYRYVPVTIIDVPVEGQIASTIRHNRARGKHQVDLMAVIVKKLIGLGLSDKQIAHEIGMTDEELLRLKQIVGAAKILAGDEYSQSWGLVEEADGHGPSNNFDE